MGVSTAEEVSLDNTRMEKEMNRRNQKDIRKQEQANQYRKMKPIKIRQIDKC